MPFMRSNKRQRARARLATSIPVNMMFSNGLGVCKIPNAGSRSICRKKTRVSTAPGAFITAVVNQFDYQGSDTDKIKLKYKTNIQGAKITLRGKIGAAAVTDLISLTLPVTNDDVNKFYEQTFKANLVGLTNGVEVSDIELTLTGGKISPSGGWNINNVETKIGVPNFTIDLAAPTYTSGEVTDAAPKKIILSFTETIAPGNIVAGDFGVKINGSNQSPTAAAVVAGKVELTLAVAVTNAQVVTVGYPNAPTAFQKITDIQGNAVIIFGGGVGVDSAPVINRVGVPIFESAQVGQNGSDNELFITSTKPIITIGTATPGNFTIGGVASSPNVNTVALEGGKVKLTLSASVVTGDGTNPTVAFTATTTVLEDAEGNQLADFGASTVINLT